MKTQREEMVELNGFLAQRLRANYPNIFSRSNSPTEHTDKTNLNRFERVLAPLFYDSATMHIFLNKHQHEIFRHVTDKIFLQYIRQANSNIK